MKTLEFKEGVLNISDQKQLPLKEIVLHCTKVSEIVKAIKELSVRGAPAIGICAAYGAVIAADEAEDMADLKSLLNEIKAARPTAVNLEWAINKDLEILKNQTSLENCKEEFLKLAKKMEEDEIETDRKMGEYGAELIKDGMTVLTHCNTGRLATVGIGTALGVITTAHSQGKNISVYADETRPLLQGGRLTAYELKQAGIPFKLIADSAAAFLMKSGKIDMIFVGADRIAKNGDTANKIGTFSLSLAARVYNVPFYIVAPKSSFDFNIESGEEIVIEERDDREICEIGGVRIAPEGIETYNPAFDVTPWENITGIISEDGIYYPKEGGFLCTE